MLRVSVDAFSVAPGKVFKAELTIDFLFFYLPARADTSEVNLGSGKMRTVDR